ncbi:hypothetical protein V2J09_002522, partial [Rumex salicifolius]
RNYRNCEGRTVASLTRLEVGALNPLILKEAPSSPTPQTPTTTRCPPTAPPPLRCGAAPFADSKYNVEAAENLANDALHLPIAEAIPIYEQLLVAYPTASQTSLEETQRMTAVRKAFQKAVVTPTHNVEQLWKDYETFENTVSRALAKGLISEYQPKFNSARAVYRERKKYVDEIDWNMLAVPPTGSYKEEQQWIAWKRFLEFEKSNPQRIDSQSANKRIGFTYEQCLMHLYHYPDIWYDYAMWQAKNGATDSAIKVFQRALKALPESEILKYAFAELEESRGAIQLAKKMYEGLLGDGSNTTAIAHIQFIRFLRRTDGVEAARKYFLDIRDSPNCTYQVYVAYAMTAFCLDKDPKMAHNVFEAGLKRFMHEPAYILEYADFLSRVNDDRNIRALFERSLSSLPTNDSIEVWKRFTQFEQTYGDLSSMLKVEQRRKEALSQASDEGSTTLNDSLQDVVSRYSFMNLLPCSSKDIEHLSRKEWLAKNMSKKMEKLITANGPGLIDKGYSGVSALNSSSNVVNPDVTQMLVYDPGQKSGPAHLSNPTASGLPSITSGIPVSGISSFGVGGTNAFDGMLKGAPALAAFIANLPTIEGPAPDVNFVLSICLQSNLPTSQTAKSSHGSEISGSSKPRPVTSGSSARSTLDRQSGKRKYPQRQDEDEPSIQSLPPPKDVFKLRQMRRAAGTRTPSASQTGSTSYGSGFSGEHSGSTV